MQGCKRTVVGLALGVAFFISGHGFAKFERTLKQFLGISCVSKNRYYDIIKLVYPHITAILDQMCEEEKNRMKDKDAAVLGSWKKPVVTSDGVWHTRGHFSKNGPFIIKNYLTGGFSGMGINACEGKMSSMKNCMLARPSLWRGSLQGSVTNRQRKRDAMSIQFGKMEIPALQSQSLNTTPTAKCTSVEGMLDVLTQTT